MPAKKLTLGSAFESMTNSKKIMNIFHRLGHVVSDDKVRGIETEMVYSMVDSMTACPSQVPTDKNLRTVCAYDNFDRFLNTKSKKVNFNDTVGIWIQDLVASVPDSVSENESPNQYSDGRFVKCNFISSNPCQILQ